MDMLLAFVFALALLLLPAKYLRRKRRPAKEWVEHGDAVMFHYFDGDELLAWLYPAPSMWVARRRISGRITHHETLADAMSAIEEEFK